MPDCDPQKFLNNLQLLVQAIPDQVQVLYPFESKVILDRDTWGNISEFLYRVKTSCSTEVFQYLGRLVEKDSLPQPRVYPVKDLPLKVTQGMNSSLVVLMQGPEIPIPPRKPLLVKDLASGTWFRFKNLNVGPNYWRIKELVGYYKPRVSGLENRREMGCLYEQAIVLADDDRPPPLPEPKPLTFKDLKPGTWFRFKNTGLCFIKGKYPNVATFFSAKDGSSTVNPYCQDNIVEEVPFGTRT